MGVLSTGEYIRIPHVTADVLALLALLTNLATVLLTKRDM